MDEQKKNSSPAGLHAVNSLTPQSTPIKSRGKTTLPSTPRSGLDTVSDQNQTDLRDDIGRCMAAEIVGCRIEIFCDHYLPPTPKRHVFNQVIAALTKAGIIQPRSDKAPPGCPNYVFKDFARSPQSAKSAYASEVRRNGGSAQGLTKVDEKSAFAPLGDIFNAIRDALKRIPGVTVNKYLMAMCPDTHLDSDIYGANFRIDACTTNLEFVNGKPQSENGKLDVTNIVVPMEFKIDYYNDKGLNRLQLTAAVNHIMNDDARRMFVYGITIEDQYVSLWYFSRSHSVKAASFSLIERPDVFVKALISLACAPDEELGFDRHIKLLPDQKYLYELPANGADRSEPMFFKTSHAVDEHRSLRIAGRSTRIWKVVEVISKDNWEQKPGTSEMVLKDAWIDEDMDTEDKIQTKLFEDIETFSKTKWKSHPLLAALRKFYKSEIASFGEVLQDFRNHFSRILQAHAKGPNKSIVEEAWRFIDLFPTKLAHRPEITSNSVRKSEMHLSSAQPASEATPLPKPRLPPYRNFTSKRRCFYVFEHICTRVSHLPTLGDALDVIHQAFLALLLMFCAGWIHRDISNGNVLAFKQSDGSWQVKLNDLEYAKRFPPKDPSEASSDPKTGTPHFMAHEIQLSRSLFRRRVIERIVLTPQSDSDSDSDSESEEGTQETPTAENNELMPIDTPVTHNYEHDLESIWWLVLWLITTRVDHEPSYTAVDDIFTGTVPPSPERITAFIGGLPRELKESLHPDLQSLFHPLESFRQRLVAGYEDRHPDNLYHSQHYSPECAAFATFWAEIKRGGDQWRKVELKDPSWVATRATTLKPPRVPKDSRQAPSTSKQLSKSGSMKRKSVHQKKADKGPSPLGNNSVQDPDCFVIDEDDTAKKPSKKSRRY